MLLYRQIQREDYKKRQDMKVSPMSNSRIKRLEDIGFEWRVIDPSHLNQWDDRFQQLVEYQKSHNGSVDVPQTYKANPMLGKWCSKQRQFYRLLKLGKKSQIMTRKFPFSFVLIGQGYTEMNHWRYFLFNDTHMDDVATDLCIFGITV
jgi:hypothetical protein